MNRNRRNDPVIPNIQIGEDLVEIRNRIRAHPMDRRTPKGAQAIAIPIHNRQAGIRNMGLKMPNRLLTESTCSHHENMHVIPQLLYRRVADKGSPGKEGRNRLPMRPF